MAIWGPVIAGVASGLLANKGASKSADAMRDAARPHSVHSPLTDLSYSDRGGFDVTLDPLLQNILYQQLGFAQTLPFFQNQYMNFVNDRYGLGMFDELEGGSLPSNIGLMQDYVNGTYSQPPAPPPPADNFSGMNDTDMEKFILAVMNNQKGIDEQDGLLSAFYQGKMNPNHSWQKYATPSNADSGATPPVNTVTTRPYKEVANPVNTSRSREPVAGVNPYQRIRDTTLSGANQMWSVLPGMFAGLANQGQMLSPIDLGFITNV